MKHVKKLASVLLAMVMVMAMTMTAFAATAALTGHTYKAYQIFAGTQSADANDVALANVTWGDGINGESFLKALKSDTTLGTTFGSCGSAADVAKALSAYSDYSGEANAFAKLAYEYKTNVSYSIGDTLSAGYYLVVDETEFAEGAENTVKNLALLQLTKKGEFTVENKTSVPTVEKKVDDKNDSNTTEDAVVWQDSADYDIGDSVPFKLEATLADNVESYTTYKIVFHDTLSKGLTYENDTVKVMFGETDVTKHFTVTSTADETTGETTLTIRCDNVKKFGATNSSVITVTYTATLNGNAEIGVVGNPNEVYLEYSNNPNESEEGDTDNTGKTPEDKVIVFTYKVVVKKVDGKQNPLTGAGFTLYKKNAETGIYEAVGPEVKGEAMTTFEWSGLDDGDYKLSETTTPDGYNTIADIYFTVTAAHDITSDDPTLTSLSGNVTTGEVTFTSTDSEGNQTGSLTTDVVNQSGTTLPETGGMGTTIFYVIGSILVLGAAVVMITRKRMAK